jgi:hypothetical protein
MFSAWLYTSPEYCNTTLTPDCHFLPLSRCQVRILCPCVLLAKRAFTVLIQTHTRTHVQIHIQQYIVHTDNPNLSRTTVYTYVRDSLSWDNAQFVTMPMQGGIDGDLIPDIADWPSRGLPWWRVQQTKYVLSITWYLCVDGVMNWAIARLFPSFSPYVLPPSPSPPPLFFFFFSRSFFCLLDM